MLSNRADAVGNAREDAGYEQFSNALSGAWQNKAKRVKGRCPLTLG